MRHQTHAGQCLFGTSGWGYADWRGVFYPEKLTEREFLSFYAQRFSTVELNNSFYHLPNVKTAKFWADSVPQDFIFSVKSSRYITHMKKLKIDPKSLHKFFNAIEPFQEQKKLGPILFQLPGGWGLNLDRLAQFIHQLPKTYDYAFELRGTDWQVPEVFQLLTENNMAFCIYNFEGFESPAIVTADFAYLRFHGPKKTPYEGKHSAAFLSRWAKQIRQWQQNGLDVYCYFDNTANGAAIHDAKRLMQLVQPEHEKVMRTQ